MYFTRRILRTAPLRVLRNKTKCFANSAPGGCSAKKASGTTTLFNLQKREQIRLFRIFFIKHVSGIGLICSLCDKWSSVVVSDSFMSEQSEVLPLWTTTKFVFFLNKYTMNHFLKNLQLFCPIKAFEIEMCCGSVKFSFIFVLCYNREAPSSGKIKLNVSW